MKCKKCGGKAAIKMPQHRLALCKEHYLDWVVNQTERFIEKYRMFSHQERILVAVSGGKDSLSLWDVLWRLGYAADGLYIDLGIDGGMAYSTQSKQFTQAFAQERGLTLHVVDVAAQYGEAIPELAKRSHRGYGKPCAVCGLSKRHIMNRIARDEGYTVLATGHNLDDEAAVLFGNTLQWAGELLLRQSPVLEESTGLMRKVKPFCRFYERETAAYALMRGIAYVYDECPFAEGSKSLYYKQILNQMEAARPGAKLTFYLAFLQARQDGLFREHERPNLPLRPCPSCGQPTTTGGECAFCRMVNKEIDVELED
ncbi:MAG TPA: ATP-binding protein [Anaerolineaceae bacterium]|nr:ATP-binding protein [Anaerolineaceae bacterium]